ncbi:hypothetical protein HanXRQr2_Chr12g0555481 [Helianthus annuus]|uniref:Uncharacterized protein n=1 Tax=Helianthus annuus TaxID=4232 RepID=A0A251T4S8_HELAN|nr:hypothetical protein HanXRQr2_Chr12g0555481 [Helianthus annuus]
MGFTLIHPKWNLLRTGLRPAHQRKFANFWDWQVTTGDSLRIFLRLRSLSPC